MRLSHPNFAEPIYFEENKINVLVIENGKFLMDAIKDIKLQQSGEEGNFIFSLNYNPIPIQKNIDLITDIFSICLNDKRIISKIFDNLDKNMHSDEKYHVTLEFKQKILTFLDELCRNNEIPLTYDADIDLTQIFKAAKLEPETPTNLCELILEYMELQTKILNIRCFIILHLKSYLSEDELLQFYREASYKKYNILLIESHSSEAVKEWEKVLIIDKDLCEIRVNY